MKRWTLRIRDAAGTVVHEERFWRRKTAETIGRFYASPLPLRVTAVTAHGRTRVGADLQLLTYEIERTGRWT